MLKRALSDLGFGAGRDRLFSVGDLIDRGPDSPRALEWLEDGRITGAVRGNHEQLMVDPFATGQTLCVRKSDAGGACLSNGGGWWYGSAEVEHERVREEIRKETSDERGTTPSVFEQRWADVLDRLPFMIAIEYETHPRRSRDGGEEGGGRRRGTPRESDHQGPGEEADAHRRRAGPRPGLTGAHVPIDLQQSAVHPWSLPGQAHTPPLRRGAANARHGGGWRLTAMHGGAAMSQAMPDASAELTAHHLHEVEEGRRATRPCNCCGRPF